MIAPMPWSVGYSATDLVFAAEVGGDRLLEKFVSWCDKLGGLRIDMGVSDDGDRPGFDRLFAAQGFTPAGRVYYRIKENGNVRA